MTLNLYRRHRRGCKAGHPEEFHSGEFDEKKKGWKRCACPIFVSGTLGGLGKRQNTGQWEWAPAKAFAVALEKAGSWTGAPPPPPPLPDQPAKSQRMTIAD